MSVAYRLFRQSDIPAIVEIINRIRQQTGNTTQTESEDIEHLIATPQLRAEENFPVGLNDAGEVIGGALFMMRPDSGMAFGDVMVRPDNQDKAVMAALIHRVETRIRERAVDEVPEGETVVLLFGIGANRQYLLPALEEAGYEAMIRQYVMHIALDKPLEKLMFPSEFAFRPFDVARDGRAVHAVFQECFADHAGDVAKIPYEQWSHQFSAPDFDPTLYDVLVQGDEIAAICLCEIKDQEAGKGLLEVLGVRPAYRKRGLGGLLLRHAFYQFQQRGFKDVVLDVDTGNSTNAVALYENAGMEVESVTTHYSKLLR